MTFGVIFTALMALLLLGYYIGKKRSIRLSDKSNQRLHSLPQHYGYLIAFWSSAPALLILLFWSVLESSVINSAIIAQLPVQFHS
jgi:phosphate transport system permease protein